MTLLLHIAWIVMTVLRFAGVLIVFAGVALFGVYFIGGNARAPGGVVPHASWRGAGPRKGMRLFALGVVLLLGAYVIKLLMPDGT